MSVTCYEISNKGSEGMIKDLSYDYERSCDKAEALQGYPKLRELAIAEEHKREIEIFEKSLSKEK